MFRFNRGFTLIELLVVITIIGILLALLIPAVNMVREEGRQTTCMNNQMQIGKAILNYETDKRRLPGVLDQIPGGATYNWVEALFPYLEHSDMWEAVAKNNVPTIQTVRLRVLVCPNDPYLVNITATTAQSLLSYGVNDQFFVSYLKNPPVDRNNNTVAPASTSKLMDRTASATYPHGQTVSPSTTIMLGERTGDGTAKYPRQGNPPFVYPTKAPAPNLATAGKWTDVPPTIDPLAVWNSLTFHWPIASDSPVPPVPISPNIMVSTHPAKVIAVFFDGHAEKIASDTVFPTGL